MNPNTTHYIEESELIKKKIGKHIMFIDKNDAGISRTLFKSPRWKKWVREPEFMDIIEKEVSEGMIALDIGANIGYVTLLLADLVGEKGQVYAVEPSPRNFSILKKNIELNNYSERVSVFQLGISNVSGTTKLYISKSSNLHSIAKSFNARESIKIKTLKGDDFLKDKPVPNFIKMDIEGAEVEAIEGMMNTLKKARPPLKILMETHPMYYSPERNFEVQLQQLFQNGFNAKYIISTGAANPSFLKSRGYKPQKIYPAGSWYRSIYTGVSNNDVIKAVCSEHEQITKRPFKSCIKRPRLFFNREIVNERIVRGIFLEKKQ